MNNNLGVNDDPPPPYESVAADSARPSHDSGATSSSHQQPDQSHGHQGQSNAAYFASRPSRASQIYTHTLYIGPNTHRSDLSYPTQWASNHDVGAQDWDTFVGYLLPETHGAGGDEKRMSDEKTRRIEGIIREWNDVFFQPRGVIIEWEGGGPHNAGSSSQTVPQRQSSQSYPHQHHGPIPPQPRPPQPQAPQPRIPQPRPPQPQPPNPNPQPKYLPRHMSTKERWTRKLKDAAEGRGVSVTPTKFSVGEIFSLDANNGNLKIGKFSMNERGMNYDGRPLGPQLPPGAHHPHLHQQHGAYHQGPYGPGYGRGRGYGPPHGAYQSSPHSPHSPHSPYSPHSPHSPQNPSPHYPPAHAGSWSPSPNPHHPGSYGPQHAQTWSNYGPPSPGGSYAPYGSASSHNGHHQGDSQTPTSNHPGQTTGTIG